jgi:outer membrane protein insertion porin family
VENPIVKQIEISGNTVISSNEIVSSLAWQKGQILNVTRLSTEMDKLAAKYRGQGYLLARVQRAGMKADNSTLEIVLYEGRVDSVTLAGQRSTRRSLIQRETRTRQGQPLNFDTAAYDIQHLYALD